MAISTEANVDLAEVSKIIASTLKIPLEGYLNGKTVMRDALVTHMGCSELEAEVIVDQLEALGFVKFDGDPSSSTLAPALWEVDPERK